jgi:hypothetical protein
MTIYYAEWEDDQGRLHQGETEAEDAFKARVQLKEYHPNLAVVIWLEEQ